MQGAQAEDEESKEVVNQPPPNFAAMDSMSDDDAQSISSFYMTELIGINLSTIVSDVNESESESEYEQEGVDRDAFFASRSGRPFDLSHEEFQNTISSRENFEAYMLRTFGQEVYQQGFELFEQYHNNEITIQQFREQFTSVPTPDHASLFETVCTFWIRNKREFIPANFSDETKEYLPEVEDL